MAGNDPYAVPQADVAVARPGEPRRVPAGRGAAWLTIAFSEFFRPQWLPWLLIGLLFFVLSIVMALVPFVGSIASTVLGPVFAGGVLLGCQAQVRGEPIQVSTLFAAFRAPQFGTLLLLGLLYLGAVFGIVLVGVLIGGGALIGLAGADAGGAAMGLGTALIFLVVLAAIIPVVMAYFFAPALIVLQGCSIADAIRGSFVGCLRAFWALFVFGLVLLLAAIVASIPLLLGWLVLLPVLMASTYVAWRDIFGPEGPPAA
jgi:uncharacterized membrane protein